MQELATYTGYFVERRKYQKKSLSGLKAFALKEKEIGEQRT